MIGKEYFRRQATTLRKLLSLTRDKVAADQLNRLVHDFEAKAGEPDAPADPSPPPGPAEDGRRDR